MANNAPIEIRVSDMQSFLDKEIAMGKKYECSSVKGENGEIIAWDYENLEGDIFRVGPTFHPWIPHERETWLYHYMTTKVSMSYVPIGTTSDGIPPQSATIPVGTRVKIVMVSRFGDVGITTDLSAENGYFLRIPIDELNEKFDKFSEKD